MGYSPWGRKKSDTTERISLRKSNKKRNSAYPPHSSPLKRSHPRPLRLPYQMARVEAMSFLLDSIALWGRQGAYTDLGTEGWTLHGSRGWGPGKERVPSPS